MHRLGYVLATCAFFLSGCATERSASTDTPYLNPFLGTGDNISYWDGDEIGGKPSIKIDLVEQRAYFYKGDQLVGVSVASTGREGYGTPPGEFRITQKDIDYASNLYGDYVDADGQVVVHNVNIEQDPQPPGTTFRGAPIPISKVKSLSSISGLLGARLAAQRSPGLWQSKRSTQTKASPWLVSLSTSRARQWSNLLFANWG